MERSENRGRHAFPVTRSLSSGAHFARPVGADPFAPSGYGTDLPDGLFGSLAVQPPLQKYFCSRLTQINTISITVPPPRGAYRDRHGRGAGCGGRWRLA